MGPQMWSIPLSQKMYSQDNINLPAMSQDNKQIRHQIPEMKELVHQNQAKLKMK